MKEKAFKDQVFIIYAEKCNEPYKVLRVPRSEANEYVAQVEKEKTFIYSKPDKFELIEIVPEFFVVAEVKNYIPLLEQPK